MEDLRAQIPPELLEEIQQRVAAGEFTGEAELVVEAIRYYLDRHSEESWREYVDKEVGWSRRRAGA